jgi:hypothetical protein
MALLADGVGQRAGQMSRVDDGIIDSVGRILGQALCGVPRDVQRSRSVAALAAERRFADLKSMRASLDCLGLPRMAEQADCFDPSPKADVHGPIVSRRQAPTLPGGVPGQRGFDEKAIHLGHVGARMPSRADGIFEGILGQRRLIRLSVKEQFAMPDPAVLAHDLIPALRQGVIEGRVGWLAGRIGLCQRAAHPGAPEGSILARVARAASRATDVVGIRFCVQEWAGREGRHGKGFSAAVRCRCRWRTRSKQQASHRQGNCQHASHTQEPTTTTRSSLGARRAVERTGRRLRTARFRW